MRLSEFELEVMQAIWRLGETNAPEIHAAINRTRDISYSAVKTIVDRLESKGAVRRLSQVGRTIVYASALDENLARAALLRDFTAKLFPGDDRIPLFNALIRDRDLTDGEIIFLRDIVEQTGGDT